MTDTETTMHVRFLCDFEFKWPDNFGCSTDFKAEWHGSVRRICGEAAIAAGAAVEIKSPGRPTPTARAGGVVPAAPKGPIVGSNGGLGPGEGSQG